MASGWHKKLARIQQMSWDEVRTRLAQEGHKRLDLARHRASLPPVHARLATAQGSPGQFFFESSEIPSRLDLLRRHLPGRAEEIVREADRICEHHFHLLGYEDLDYGREIDWHLDRVHGKHAPLDPWFRIPFLEFAVVGDHKVTWELNRHQHLVTLAKAFLLSGESKYLAELLSQWRRWIKANPYPLGINWGSSLEVAFRSLSWIWVDQLLAESAEFGAVRGEFREALGFHARYIERFLSTYFSPNTHLLGEALALFFTGTLYPQFEAAPRWQENGWQILLSEAQRQVRSDGVYFEQSLHYHVYALDFFLHARLLARRNDLTIPAEFNQTVRRMLDVVKALAQAGPPEGFGDDDGGRLFDPHRNRTEHMSDPLALGKAMFYTENGAAITEEAIWLFGSDAVRAESAESRPAELGSVSFKDAGLYVFADSEPVHQVGMIDAGPQGIGRCGHGHADALSLRLTVNGARWLLDSGSGVYISSDPADRNTFRGTAAHNTLRVDGLDQAVPQEPFSWTDIPTTSVERWAEGKTFTYFCGQHNGYERLAQPVTHRRSLLKVKNGPWLVRDIADGKGEHDLEAMWHFAPRLLVSESKNGIVVAEPDAPSEAVVLRMVLPNDTKWQKQVTRTLISPAYGKLEPAPVIRMETHAQLPAELATVLIAETSESRFAGADLTSMNTGAVQVYQLSESRATQAFFFSLHSSRWSFGPWSSDAELLFCRIDQEQLVHLVMVGGASTFWQGQELIRLGGPASFFEWHNLYGFANSDVKSFSISPLFAKLTGGATLYLPSIIPSTFAEQN